MLGSYATYIHGLLMQLLKGRVIGVLEHAQVISALLTPNLPPSHWNDPAIGQ